MQGVRVDFEGFRELRRDRANSKVDKSEFYSKKNSKRGRMRGKFIISSINFMWTFTSGIG